MRKKTPQMTANVVRYAGASCAGYENPLMMAPHGKDTVLITRKIPQFQINTAAESSKEVNLIHAHVKAKPPEATFRSFSVFVVNSNVIFTKKGYLVFTGTTEIMLRISRQ